MNHAGGEILLDERVRGVGCQHQKLVVLRRPGRHDRDVAFVGGVDLCHGRGDDERHLGDPQVVPMDRRYGSRPPWHDVQLEIRGPAVTDFATSFRERWQDPTPLDHRNPWRSVARGYSKAFQRARRLIYVEDQFLWSVEVAQILAAALRRSPLLRLIAVVPRYPDQDGHFTGPPNRIGQQAALDLVTAAGATGSRSTIWRTRWARRSTCMPRCA